MPQRPFYSTARAFTLLELLSCIVVVALLVGLVFPALARARSVARMTKSAANARTLSTILATYAESRGGRYPFIEAGVMYPTDSNTFLVSFPYWQVFETWSGVIYNDLPYDANHEVFLSPTALSRRTSPNGEIQPWPSSYAYSMSFVGHPLLWADQPSPADPLSLQRPARTHEVSFPSQKALLWDDEAPFARSRDVNPSGDVAIPVPIGMADNAVRILRPSDASQSVTRPINGPRQTSRLHNTANGVRGIDF